VMVRRDTSGVVTVAVEESVRHGRELLAWGQAVADETSFECWRAARRRWLRRTCRVLTLQFEAEAVHEFMCANRVAGETWEERLRAELRAMRNALELLRSLAGTLGS
jgi:hypothetical protein